MSNNYSDPDGQSMDDMNDLREKLDHETELYRQCLCMFPEDDGDRLNYLIKLKSVYLPTKEHIRVLLSRIHQLEQSLLREVSENQEPY